MSMSCETNLSLVLVAELVDEQASRVLWAESGGDDVDVLFSFLTLPLGTAVRVLGKQSGIGCADDLYKSVEALDESYFQTPCCKNMLLRPRSAAVRLSEDLPAKVDDGELTCYTCSDDKSCIEEKRGIVFSTVKGTCCRCGGATDRSTIKWRGRSTEGAADGVFIDRGGRFCISDDLCISPLSASTTLSLLQRCGLQESTLGHMNVQLSRERILMLLQKSLTSKTPLTDTFLQKPEHCQPNEQLQYSIFSTDQEAVIEGCAGREFKARLVKSRAKNEVMYAEIGEDVADLLFNFLTIPLGSIVRLMGKKGSRVGCMDNLYQSVEKLCATKYCAKLEKHRDMLLAPKIATHFGCSNQLLDVDEVINSFKIIVNECAQTAVQINPKFGNGSTKTGGNFVRGKPGTFMVTDEMMVMPNSSLSGLGIMNGWDVHVSDIELKEVDIGSKEALTLLRGLLVSRTPLTHAFCQTKNKGFRRSMKQER